jgi:hypothetical protein
MASKEPRQEPPQALGPDEVVQRRPEGGHCDQEKKNELECHGGNLGAAA